PSGLPREVEQPILDRSLLDDNDSVLVAVSGGLDSMALLHLLHHLAKNHRWQLHVAHFNHLLRGKGSDADEELVKKTAEKLSLPFFVARSDVRKFAATKKLSIEMAA